MSSLARILSMTRQPLGRLANNIGTGAATVGVTGSRAGVGGLAPKRQFSSEKTALELDYAVLKSHSRIWPHILATVTAVVICQAGIGLLLAATGWSIVTGEMTKMKGELIEKIEEKKK